MDREHVPTMFPRARVRRPSGRPHAGGYGGGFLSHMHLLFPLTFNSLAQQDLAVGTMPGTSGNSSHLLFASVPTLFPPQVPTVFPVSSHVVPTYSHANAIDIALGHAARFRNFGTAQLG